MASVKSANISDGMRWRTWTSGWRPRFRLRSLLLLTTAVAVLGGGLRWRRARIHELDQALMRLYGLNVRVHFDQSQEQPPAWRRAFNHVWGQSEFPPVVSLEFRGGTLPREAIHACLPRLRQVQWVNIQGVALKDDDLAWLDQLPDLERVSLDFQRTSLDDEMFLSLQLPRDLSSLNFRGTDISDKALAKLESAKRLRSLDLQGTQVTDEGLRHLIGHESLARLNLSGTNITDEGLRHLATNDDLEFLVLADTHVTDAGLWHLARQDCLTHLDLSGTRVTDQGLRHLSDFTWLQSIYLHDTQVQGRGLRYLQGIDFLLLVSVDGSPALWAALPEFHGLPRLENMVIHNTNLAWWQRGLLYLTLPDLLILTEEEIRAAEAAYGIR